MSQTHRDAFANGTRDLTGFVKKQYVQGKYKNIHFRSSLEFAFMLKCESLGKILGQDILSEHIRIPYVGLDKNIRTYITDFYDVNERTIYEIKHSNDLNNELVILKFTEANKFCEQNNMKFVVFTEVDLEEFTFNRKRIEEFPDVVSDQR